MKKRFIKNFKINAQQIKAILLCSLLVLASSRQYAQSLKLLVTQSPSTPTVQTGNLIIDTINYSCSSFTTKGNNVVINLALPTNLVPYITQPFSNSVAYDASQVSTVTYDSLAGNITIKFIPVLPAGSTGQLQIKMAYKSGSTPNGYAPNIIASINATNYVDSANNPIGPVYDTMLVVAQASNNYKITKSIKGGGAIDNETIYKIEITSSATPNQGTLDISSPVVVDTLPVGALFVRASAFDTSKDVTQNSNPPVYDSIHNIVTWTWPSNTVFTNYKSYAFISLKYQSTSTPAFHIGDNVCNTATLSGLVSSLPIGTDSTETKVGVNCSTLTTQTPQADCNGGGITAATAYWLDHHILAGTIDNRFANGWYNSGNTKLDSVTLTYTVDKSIDMDTVHVGPVYDGFDSVTQAHIFVSYATNLNPSFTFLDSLYSLDIYNKVVPSDYAVKNLASGEYITQVSFKIIGDLPIGGYQDLSYKGYVRTALQKAKDSTTIVEGNYYPVKVIGDDGTVVLNNSSGSYYFNGVKTDYSACSDSAEIIFAQPAFHDTYKSITNSDNNFKPSDTVSYQLHTFLGGNANAINVTFTDTLDYRLSNDAGDTSFLTIGKGSPQPITPTFTNISGNRTIITFNLDTLANGLDYWVNFKAIIKPATLPNNIYNKATLNSTNALFNTTTDSVPLTIISAVALQANKGQSGCDSNFVYYPNYALAQGGGPVNYKITLKNLGNVPANNLTLVDVFPFKSDYRGSQWYANLLAPVTVLKGTGTTVYYTATYNPCYSDFTPSTSPSGCNKPSWSTTPPVDITTVTGIKIVRPSTIQVLDSVVLSWPMRAPVGVPAGLLMNNSIMYQINRADNGSQLLPAVPNIVGMYTNCTQSLGSIGNYCWVDSNKNGLQDERASLGLNGVQLYLYSTGPDGKIGGGDDVLVDSTITANDWTGSPGYYKFTDVATGNYYVKFPTNYNQYKISPVVNQAPQVDSNSDADTTTGFSEVIAINTAGTGQDKDNTTIDAGFYPTGTLGNYVWFDINANGKQDDGTSSGINGIKVYLYEKDSTGVFQKVDSTITANNSGKPGYYNFNLVDCGQYQVGFPLKVSTKVITTQTTTAGVDNNSDANVATGLSPIVVMDLIQSGINRNNPTIDAGYRCNVPKPVISGDSLICNQSTSSLKATVIPDVYGATYTWYKDGKVITGSTLDSIITTVAGSTPSPEGNYTVTTTDTGACTSSASIPYNVHIPTPIAYNVQGSGYYCSSTTGKDVSLSSSEKGVTYQLYQGASPIGSPIRGTGSSIDFGTQTVGTYTISATNDTATCTYQMNGNAILTIAQLPAAVQVQGGGLRCDGDNGLPISATTGELNVKYSLVHLPSNSVVASTNGPTVLFNNVKDSGFYDILASSTFLSSCKQYSTDSVHITIINPFAYTVTGGKGYCAGGNGVHIGLSGSDTTVIYQLYKNGTPLGNSVVGNGQAIDFGIFKDSALYSVIGTSTLLTNPCQKNMANTVKVFINPNPTLTGATLVGPACTGTSASVKLTGLLPNTTSIINYSIDNVIQTPVQNVVSDANGNATFSTRVLDINDAWKNLEITGVSVSSASPYCTTPFQYYLTLYVNPSTSVTSIGYDNGNGKSTFCQQSFAVASAIINGTKGGTFTSTPAGLSVNASNGDIYTGSSLAGTYTVFYSVGLSPCVSSATTTVTIVAQPSVSFSYDGNPYCKNDSSSKASPTLTGSTGGLFTSSPAGLVIDSITGVVDVANSVIGSYTINYTFSVSGCTSTVSTWFGIYSCSVSSGNAGGTESKSLGDIITKRIYHKALEGTNGMPDYNKLPVYKSNNSRHLVLSNQTLQSVQLSDLLPVLNGYISIVSSPTDLTSFTNAKEVQSIDYTKSNQAKAVAFATKTTGELYSHSKPICDRLKGSSLISIDTIVVNGYSLVTFALQSLNGNVEYATSFSIGVAQSRNTYSVQSNWLMKDYVGDETMYNFQLWAVSPQLVKNMATEVFNKLSSIANGYVASSTANPQVYIVSGKRIEGNLNLVIKNNTTNTNAVFQLNVTDNESINTSYPKTISVSIAPNANTTVQIPFGDIYESDITMNIGNKVTDVVYMSDGAWAIDYPKNSTTLQSFKVTNNSNRIFGDDYPVLRDVSVKAMTSEYVTLSKALAGGGIPVDLSDYKTLQFTASGGNYARITLVNNNITDWSKQYSILVPLSSDEKDYLVSLGDFVSNANPNKLDLSSISALVISIEVGTGVNSQINNTIKGISFTKQTPVSIPTTISKEITIAPNPNTGKFNVTFNADNDNLFTLRIVDASSGKLCYNKSISVKKGLNTIAVDISNIASAQNNLILSLGNDKVNYNVKKLLVGSGK